MDLTRITKSESTSRSLSYFAAVAKHGSVRGAAGVLNIAASAINRQILDLEFGIGVPLFHRLPRGMRLTSAGELLLAHIQRTSRDFEVVRSQIEELQGLRRGAVRIAIIEAVVEATAEQIALFNQTHPRVSFEFKVMGSAEVITAVTRDEVDLGIAFNPPIDRQFYALAEAQQALCAVMSRTHPLAGRQSLRFSDCLAYPILLADSSFGGRILLDNLMDGGPVAAHPTVVGNSIAVMKILVATSDAICFQIEAGARSNETLTARPLSDQALTGRMVLGVKRGRQLPAVAAVFAETLKTSIFV